VPRAFGRYELIGEVARGGMGVVYKAWDTALNRLVALKTLQAEQGQQRPELVQRFLREPQAFARLSHPHIVPVFDVGLHDGQDFFAMGFMPGGSLADHRDRFAEPRAAAALVEKVARAVQHVHEQQVLHRDLKPANILLDEQGEPRVTDFGLAKLCDSDLELTRPGAVIGTAAYMAPEQAAGQVDQIGATTDVWALGVILYELITGRRPFEGRGRAEYAYRICIADPPHPRALRRGLPRDLETIALKCLEKQPGQRYPSAGAVAADLARWLAGEPILARPPSYLRRLRRIASRHPAAYTAAALVLAFLAALPLLLGVGKSVEPPDSNLLPIQQALKPGAGVELIPEQGLPPWYRWRVGGEELYRPLGDPSVLALRNWQDAALELLPAAPAGSYRLHAVLKNYQRSGLGAGGVYVARVQWPGPEEEAEQWWVSLAVGGDETTGNVTLKAHRRTGRARRAVPDADVDLLRRKFPGDPPVGVWRRLQIEVTPTHIAAFREGELIGQVTPKELGPALVNLAGKKPKTLTWPPLPTLLRGGLGLYTEHLDAWFHSVVVEPLE
jgi:serine/threonine-protein kinase